MSHPFFYMNPTFEVAYIRYEARPVNYDALYNEAFKQIEAMGKEMAPIGEIQEHVEAMASHCLACMVDIETIMNGL